MQMQLVIPEKKGFGVAAKSANDPETILQLKIEKTYGKAGKLDIYNQDRKAAIDSFKCYWQIDYMIREREYKEFPLFRVNKIIYDDHEVNADDIDDDLGGQNLKKPFLLPPTF